VLKVRRGAIGVALLVGLVGPATRAVAQAPLTLEEAMRLARTASASARALSAADSEAEERVRQARAGYLPRVDVAESVQRGNQPVLVFGSLLAQQRFTPANFDIDSLNHPSPVTNVRTSVSIAQPLFDAGATRLSVERASIGRDLVAAAGAGAQQDLALGAAQAFVRVLDREAVQRSSRASVESAESDLARAQARLEVGLVTDADVLDVEVHLADARQREVAATADLAIARLELNQAIGAPLDQVVALVNPDAPASGTGIDALIQEALASRSDRRGAVLRSALASNQSRSARAAFLPQVTAQGGWEFNGQGVSDQRSSWTVGADVRVNLFRGFGDRARLAEARFAEVRAKADDEQVVRAIEVDVRSAVARLDAARERARVGERALAQARESQRIVRDRYDGGLATIGDVLRAATAVSDAESRSTASQMDVIVQSVALERAVGRL
jgi:outer membrane protein TolC